MLVDGTAVDCTMAAHAVSQYRSRNPRGVAHCCIGGTHWLTMPVSGDGMALQTLHGLRDRVAGVEGRLRIASPVGGPTVVSVDLPCES